MSTDQYPANPVFRPRSARVEANRKKPFKAYKYTPNGARYNLPITELQSRRLQVKNLRRALHGLPPCQTYAEI